MWLTALIFGLLGSFHCVGMCGPIAFLLPLDRKSKSKRLLQIVNYHVGRLLTYGIIGLLFGFVGRQLHLFGIQQQLSIALGIMMILVIIVPVRVFDRSRFLRPIYSGISRLRSMMGHQLKDKTPGTFVTLGLLNGLLPCGLIYMALFGALAAGGIWEGGLYMVLFGLGTIPLMTSAIYLGNFLTQTVKQRIVKLIPVFVFVIGVLFVLRGMGLGIPYLSPSDMVTVEKVDASHECH